MKYRTKAAEGSFGDLIQRFRKSPRYLGWSRGTKKHADRVLSDLYDSFHATQVSAVTRGAIIGARDSLSHVPGAANNWLKVIRLLLDYAVDLEFIAHNPAREKIDNLKPSRLGGFRTWREDEIEAYLAHHPLGTMPHTVLTLALYTAAAPVDLVKLGWPNVQTSSRAHGSVPRLGEFDDGGGSHPDPRGGSLARLRYRRQKTERRKGAEETPLVNVAIMAPLAEALATIPPGRMTFLETVEGLPRSQGALSHQLRRWVALAGLGEPDRNGRHLTLHGLRKAMGRRLAEAGASAHEIASVLGHESLASVQVYTRMYDRAKAADAALDKLGEAAPSNVTRLKRKE
jgi:integrase